MSKEYDKEDYSQIRLVLKPTPEQLERITGFFKQFDELCTWLQAEASTDLKDRGDLWRWSYSKLKEKGAYSTLADRVIGKVYSHRKRKIPLDASFILYDQKTFTFRKGELSLKFPGKREIIQYEVSGGENTRRFLNKSIPQSGVLRKGDKDYLFLIRVYPPKTLAYRG